MKKYILFLLFLSGIQGGYVCIGQPKLPDTLTARFTEIVSAFRSEHHIPGLAMTVMHGDETIYEKALGYTDIEHGIRAATDSRFPIMSVTKTFTATMLMQLAEQGIVHLEDDVKKYLPEFRVRSGYPGTGVTTLLQLATHSAGLPRNSPADYNFNASWDRWVLSGGKGELKGFSISDELLHSLQFIQLDYPSYDYVYHKDRHYSNLGYSILGIALERAVGMDGAQYMKEHIFEPLGMSQTGFLEDQAENKEMAQGYWYDKASDSLKRVPYVQLNSARYPGGMYATARDLGRYVSFQYGTDDPEFSTILSADNRARMPFFKIGWKQAYPYVLHEGALPGYRSIVVFNPKIKVGWVILTNGNDVDFNEINGQLAEILNEIYGIPETMDLAGYTGTYILPDGSKSISVYLKNGQLYSSYLEDILQQKPMIPDGDNRFKVAGDNGYGIGYDFVMKDSRIVALRLGQFVWYKKDGSAGGKM